MEQQNFTPENNGVFHNQFGCSVDNSRDVQEKRVRMLYDGASKFKLKG